MMPETEISEAQFVVCVRSIVQNIQPSLQVKPVNTMLTCRGAFVQRECVNSSARATPALRAAAQICWVVDLDVTSL